jgi:Ca-activated chloride channel family protein
MRTRLVSLCFVLMNVVPGVAADDSNQGPRLLENQTNRRRPTQIAKATAANIRVDVNMALVPVTVLDNAGQNVLGLDRENFRVIDGTEQRPIVAFGQTDAPISVGVIFDSSRSMREKFRIARQAPGELFKRLNPEDESFLITVAEQPVLRQDFTSAFSDIQNALLFTNPNGTTSLLDGVYMGLQHLKKAKNPRKALVVVSDGGDNNSRYTLRELAALAAESDTQIFSICLFESPQTAEEADGPGLLTRLAQASGGINFLINSINDMRTAFGKVGVTLHNQYVLGYYPPENAPAGKYRKITVQLLVPTGLPKLQIYSRNGYYVPER